MGSSGQVKKYGRFRLVDSDGSEVKRFATEAGARASFVQRFMRLSSEIGPRLSLEELDDHGDVVRVFSNEDLSAQEITVTQARRREERLKKRESFTPGLADLKVNAGIRAPTALIPMNAYEPWDGAMEQQLLQLYKAGKTISDLAKFFGRSESAVRGRLRVTGLSGRDIALHG